MTRPPRSRAQLAAIVRRGDHVLVAQLLTGRIKSSARHLRPEDVDAAIASVALDGLDPEAIHNRLSVSVSRARRVLGVPAAQPARVAS